jgi:resuscitation-promoting factor RpfB
MTSQSAKNTLSSQAARCMIQKVLVPFAAVFTLVLLLTGCFPTPTATPTDYAIKIEVDGKQSDLAVPAGTTAQMAIERAKITLNPLDRLEPAGFTVLAPGDSIRVIRVREVFENQEITIPFDHQVVKNESLPENQTMRIQAGQNGIEQDTYRQVFENDQEVSRTIFKRVILTEPRPEINMVGVQKPFSPVAIPGRLVYLAGGNAWMMEKDTGERKPLVTSADLDGRIFSLSPDGGWLLFTRKSTRPSGEEINTLWMLNVDEADSKPVNLRVANIVHFASWVPAKGLTVAYSTVEPRATAPGWQANNDLIVTTYSPSGIIIDTKKVIEANTGGVYGWWGTSYAWSPDGARLAYARPDGVGLVDMEKDQLSPILDITPYQTGADWAWVTGLAWAPNHRVLFMTSHPPKAGLDNQENSPLFDLTAAVMDGGPTITLSPQSGMFSYPVASPLQPDKSFLVAFLQAIFPEQSDSGRYRLVVMERDGSNRKVIFPQEGLPGLEPQQIVWSRKPFPQGYNWIAVIYQGNLWLVDPFTGESHPITGDGLIKKIDW